MKYLYIGTVGSFFNSIGIVFIGKACSIGPIGPVYALVNLNTLMFAAYESFYLARQPLPLELAGMLMGVLGAVILTFPNLVSRFC